jgi:hypothetical protein
MNLAEDVRMFEALLCTLLVREGGTARLPLKEVADCGNHLRICIRPTRQRDAVELAVRPIGAQMARRKRRA